MGSVRFIGILLLLLTLCTQARSEGQLLLIDRSGSMSPYYQSGLVKIIGQRIMGLMANQQIEPVKVGGFSDRVELYLNVDQIQVGGPTYLDAGIDFAINNQYSIAWMITDNIMHRSGEEAGKTKEFYERLKQDKVSRVVIFPLKQEPGKGTAGIIVYALLLSPNADTVFRKETEEFAHLTTNTARLPMKPLDRDTIETIFVESPSTDKKNKLPYGDGSVVKESMEIRFKSKFDHLRIIDADIVSPRVSPEFSQNSLLNFEKDDVKITPSKITELGPGNQTTQVYTVTVDLGKIKLKRDFKSLWKAALKDPNEEVFLDLSFSIRVPKDKFQLSESFLRDYNAETTEKAKSDGKIYDLNELPMLVTENNTSIVVPHKPKIRVQYPWWLVFIFPGIPILIALVVISCGILAWWLVKRILRKKSQWTVVVQSPPLSTAKVQRGQVIVTAAGKQNRLGDIKGREFIPATGVQPNQSQVIKDGMPVTLIMRKKEYSLIFRGSSSPDGTSRPVRKEKKRDGKRNDTKI